MLTEIKEAMFKGEKLTKSDYPLKLMLGFASSDGREWTIRLKNLRKENGSPDEAGSELLKLHKNLQDHYIYESSDGYFYAP